MKLQAKQAGILFVLTAIGMISLSGCGGDGAASGGGSGSGGGSVVEITGAGASFPAPLYQRWFKDYGDSHADQKVEYASVGSGAGIKQFTEGLVDFGASDAAMNDEEIAQVEEGVVLLPMTAGSIVLAYNLNDASGQPVAELKLSREAYTGIFLGKITNWNDPAIAKSNEGVAMPDKPISVVVRADSSGTTYVFTQHLASVSQEWADGPGIGKTIDWPVGSAVQKNDGIAGSIKTTDGTIGYVEFGFAEKGKIPMASLENKSGTFVKPTLESAQAALAGVAEMPADLRVWLPDPDGGESYPIVTYTWILCRKTYDDAAKLETLKSVLDYCLTEGQKISGDLGYIPLPENVIEKVKAAIDTITVAEHSDAA